MLYLPLSDNAARQAIDATAIFQEWRVAQGEASRFSGGMYFRREGDYEYLVRTRSDNRQQRLRRRDPTTEAQWAAFTQGKQQAQERLTALSQALREAERMNKALKVGRVPTLVVDLMNELERSGLAPYFTVVGTHAMYAYEAAASVRFQAAALATQDVDLLWDVRKRVQFFSTLGQLDTSVLGVLQRVDPSFRRMEGQLESAINNRGFAVDFLRRMAQADDPHPVRFSSDEDDLWPVQAKQAEQFLQAPRYEVPVVSVTGRMALMSTVKPSIFVAFKRWLSELADRPPAKRRRDRLQADTVQRLLDESLLLDIATS